MPQSMVMFSGVPRLTIASSGGVVQACTSLFQIWADCRDRPMPLRAWESGTSSRPSQVTMLRPRLRGTVPVATSKGRSKSIGASPVKTKKAVSPGARRLRVWRLLGTAGAALRQRCSQLSQVQIDSSCGISSNKSAVERGSETQPTALRPGLRVMVSNGGGSLAALAGARVMIAVSRATATARRAAADIAPQSSRAAVVIMKARARPSPCCDRCGSTEHCATLLLGRRGRV